MNLQTRSISKPYLLLLVFVTLFCLFLGYLWIPKDATNQELLANYSKALEYFRGFAAEKSWPWWTPFSNMGQSMADYLGTIITYAAIFIGSQIFGAGDTLSLGSRIVSLLIIPASAFGMYLFVRELANCRWIALAAALLYVLFPQLHLRLAYSEHLVVAFCFPYPPLILWSLLKLARERCGTWKYSLSLAASYAAMSLSYLRSAAVFLPVILFFTIWLWAQKETRKVSFFKGIAWGIIVFLFLALLPNLPFFREQKWMVLFAQSPLEGWQATFSMKSALAWLDRDSSIFSHAAFYFNRDIGGFYIGIVSMLVCGALFLVPDKSVQWLSTKEGRLFKLFFAIYLLLQWMSYGTRSVIAGHFDLLRGGQELAQWAVPLAWFLLALQCYMICRMWPKHRFHSAACGIACLVYLFLKPFWILEKIPLFNQIRAPWVFWEVGGTFALAVAVAFGLFILIREVPSLPRKIFVSLLFLCLTLWDMSPYFKKYAQGDLPPKTFDDFLAVQKFLSDSKKAGSISFESGRYFYLMTPQLSRRALLGEAFHNHFKSKWISSLLGSPVPSLELTKTRFNICGVAYIVLDKHDPDLPQDSQNYYRNSYPTVFENDHFAVLENPDTLAPAFIAQEYIGVKNASEQHISPMLTYSRFSYATVEVPLLDYDDPLLAGEEVPNSGLQLYNTYVNKRGISFMQYGEPWQRTSYHSFSFKNLPPDGGWLIIPESYHPDWEAYGDGRKLSTYKAFVGLLATRIPPGTSSVSFYFSPPYWYNLCLWMSFASWSLVCIVLGCLGLSSLLFQKREADELSPSADGTTENASSLAKILVVTPTYNESQNIGHHIESVLGSDPRIHLLVIDDASPDQTASFIEKHTLFNSRLFLIKRTGERGYASACRTGFKECLARDYDAAMTMDADHSHSYQDMPELIRTLEDGNDMVVGSRYIGGIRIHNWPFRRLALSMMAGVYVRALTRLPLTDPTSGFKLIRKNVLQSFDWEHFKSEGYAFNIETQYFAWQKGFSIAEVPITFVERSGGQSKMTFYIMLEAAWRVAKLAFYSLFRRSV